MNEAWNEGFIAFKQRKSKRENPYKLDDKFNRQNWFLGFSDAEDAYFKDLEKSDW